MSDEVTSPRLRNEQTTGDLKKAITDLTLSSVGTTGGMGSSARGQMQEFAAAE